MKSNPKRRTSTTKFRFEKAMTKQHQGRFSIVPARAVEDRRNRGILTSWLDQERA